MFTAESSRSGSDLTNKKSKPMAVIGALSLRSRLQPKFEPNFIYLIRDITTWSQKV